MKGHALTLTLSALGFLAVAYLAGFATRAEVEVLKAQTESRFDKVLTALCIIDERTCKIKE